MGSEAKSRDVFFDNAKFFLIFLVVWGHALGPFLKVSSLSRVIYLWIHFFHIPAFVFIAGYFSSAVFSQASLKKNAVRLLLPYGILQILFTALDCLLRKHDWMWLDFLSRPYFHLWFLPALFYWRSGLFLIMKSKYPFLLAVFLSLAAGFLPLGRELSLARAFTFLPFFVLGHQVKNWDLSLLGTRLYRLAAACVLAFMLTRLLAFPGLNEQWLFGCYPYAHFEIPLLWAPLYRAAIIGIGMLMSAAFLALIPKGQSFLTGWGARSLYVYLFHLPLLKILKYWGFFKIIPAEGAVIISFLLAAAITALLSSGLFQRGARFLAEPGK